jgi:NAD(P)-dependent dehydrogenase (short-subunit alcohol dehydrogenase family)
LGHEPLFRWAVECTTWKGPLMPVAVVTGASRGLGRAVAHGLAARGWDLVVDARTPADLVEVAQELRDRGAGSVAAVAGSVAEPGHRAQVVEAVEALGGLDLLVNNASLLGPSPQPRLADYPLDTLEQVYSVNVIAPLALTQRLLVGLRERGGTVVNVTSDASVEPYDGWGGYGSSKAALDQLTAILAAEEPTLRIYAFDPGDMRTRMHQEAFPGEDISDRPEPETVVPLLLRLVDERPSSGRFRASDLREQAMA